MTDSKDFWLPDCETYEDYLDAFLSIEDFRYIQNIQYGRTIVQLGYRSSMDVYRPKEFEERKNAAIVAKFPSKKSAILHSVGITIVDPVLRELARREKPNVQKSVSTIIFVTYKLKTGFDVSGYIDFEESLRNKENGLNWSAIFSGKAFIIPRRTDLSFYHWRSGKVINKDSDNYSVVNDPQYGLMFMYRGDRKFICVDHTKSKYRINSYRSMVSSEQSVVMRTPRIYAGDNGGTFQNMKNCNCCPYGYHIDLDFIRYCESFAKVIPSNGQLLRRDRRRSRKSLEFMLGLEHLFDNWEPTANVQSVPEVSLETEPESPRVANITQQLPYIKESSSSPHFAFTTDRGESSKSATPSLSHHQCKPNSIANSPPETSAFVHDALDAVVSDFERTLERTKTKDKQKRNCYSWEEYIDIIDSCVSGNKQQNDHKFDEITISPIPPTPPPRRERVDNGGGTTEIQALYKIRQQMAISLRRMNDLEEQVKNIPLLQSQIIGLNEEKLRLQRLLQQKEDEITKAKNNEKVMPLVDKVVTSAVPQHEKLRNKSTSPISFTPQLITPISLESLGSRIRTNTTSEKTKKEVIKRDVGTMFYQQTRDIAVGTSIQMTRSIGTSPLNTECLSDILYTKKEFDNLLQVSLIEFQEKQKLSNKLKLVSIGTQMIPISPIAVKHITTQTPHKKLIPKMSVGVMAVQKSCDAMTTCKPDTRTIGTSDHRINDQFCDQCSIPKVSIGCGPDALVDLKKNISLKQMELPIRSLSFSLGENEKLNIQRKTIGTQYQIVTSSTGVQHSPICHNQSSQCQVDTVSHHTDTRDLIKLCNFQTNTDPIYENRKLTHDFATNTQTIRTIDHAVNTTPLASVQHSSSNTDHIHKKDASCGEINQPPHILIACSDNYCDSCKDAIKNLAKDFTKITPPSPLLGRDSRIPRPKTSPRPIQKKFVRQNTYTVDFTPSSSPSPEKTYSESYKFHNKPISCSLDSLQSPNKNVPNPMSHSYTNDEVAEPVHISSIESKPHTMVNLQGILAKEEIRLETSWVKDPSPKRSIEPLPSPPLATEEAQPISNQYPEPNDKTKESQMETVHRSHHQQAMLLNKIATSTLMPREKSTPSKEMKAALKVINDTLQKFASKSSSLKSANSIVQKEWFRISSTDTANPHDVEDYLDCFEEFSNVLLKYVVNLIDSNGNTAMHYAVSHGNFDVVSILLDSKVCNVNQMNNAGYTCVMLVSLAKLKNSAHRTVVQRLFQMADVNIRAKKHCQTALMLAVSHGNLDMVEMLLGAGADINIQDEDGSTALMCAAEHGRIDIVKHLLSQSDCDSLIQDIDNSTAFKIAWQAGHRDIGLLLYVHEQMLRSKLPGANSKTSVENRRSSSKSPQKHESSQ